MPVQGTGLPQGLLLRPATPPEPVLASVMPGTPAAARAAFVAAMDAVTLLELPAPPSVTPQPMMKPLPAELALTQSVRGCRLDTAHRCHLLRCWKHEHWNSLRGSVFARPVSRTHTGRAVQALYDAGWLGSLRASPPGSDARAGSWILDAILDALGRAYGHRPQRRQGRRPEEEIRTCRPWRTLELQHGKV